MSPYDKSMMLIRPVITGDIDKIIPFVISLSKQYFIEEGNDLPDWYSKTLEKSSFLARLNGNDYYNISFEENGEIIGYASFKKPNNIYHLFVKASNHRSGVARLLWNAMKDAFPADHYTVRSSIYAIPVYEKFGFRPAGQAKSQMGLRYQPMVLNIDV